MNISPAEAVRRYDVSKPTLYADMNDGKLSYQVDDKKRRRINVAELERLYSIRGGTEETQSTAIPHRIIPNSAEDVESKVRLEIEVEYLRKQLEDKKIETENWQKAYEKAQDTAQRVTLLLEDKSQTNEKEDRWQSSIEALESRIANQENKAKEEQERAQKILRQNQALKKALEEEKKKSFWQKLFG